MIGWPEVVLRSAGLFVGLLVITRLVGSKPKFSIFDVTPLVIAAIAAACSTGLLPSAGHGAAAIITWAFLAGLTYYLAMKSKTAHDLVLGKETVLINHGKVLEDKLMEAKMSPEDLMSHLRRQNIFRFADVEFAVLEPTGTVSALLKKDQQSVTPSTLGMQTVNESVPQTVILDGNIMDDHLTAQGVNRQWLMTELEKAGAAPENVFIAQVDSLGQLYLDLFDDAVQTPEPKVRELTMAALKKCQADCELFALQTDDAKAKEMYCGCAEQLHCCVQELEPLLLH